MHSNIVFTNSTSIKDLKEILSIQALNHYSNITDQEFEKEGFVTCVHDLDLLTKMNSPYPHIIAKDIEKDEVVAYALVMTRDHSEALDVLKPMFDRIDSMSYKGVELIHSRYVIMGQICVAKEYRSMGIFGKLYETMALQLKDHFQFIITEIDGQNTKSLAAHKRSGYETIDIYKSGKEWHIVIKEI